MELIPDKQGVVYLALTSNSNCLILKALLFFGTKIAFTFMLLDFVRRAK